MALKFSVCIEMLFTDLDFLARPAAVAEAGMPAFEFWGWGNKPMDEIKAAAGFVGEIVRGGIVAVRRGQWEAATALGLTRAQTYRLVVLPLALRSIVPPMNSQYINVIKNSTLAIVVGYQDFMTVMSTMINKTSHAIEGVAMILGVFLLVNLALSALLNAYNRRIAIVER